MDHNKKELISIIIPAYNCGNFIKNTIHSVLNQTYENFEVIIIDDGSTDNTISVINEINDDRIKVISQVNKGVSFARNRGLKEANGKWITYIDADDIIYDNMLETMIKNSDDIDLVISGFEKIIYKNGYVQEIFSFLNKSEIGTEVLSKRDFLNNIDNLLNNYLINSVWGKLYKKDIIISNNVSFCDDINYAEDTLFVLDYLKYINKICIINKILYRYNILSKQSLSFSNKDKRYAILRKVNYSILSLLLSANCNKDFVYNTFFNRTMESFISSMIELQYSEIDIRSQYCNFRSNLLFPEIQLSISALKNRKKSYRLIHFLISYNKLYSLFLLFKIKFISINLSYKAKNFNEVIMRVIK